MKKTMLKRKTKNKSSFRNFLTENLSEKQIQESMKTLKEKGLIVVEDGEPYLTVDGKKMYKKLIEKLKDDKNEQS